MTSHYLLMQTLPLQEYLKYVLNTTFESDIMCIHQELTNLVSFTRNSRSELMMKIYCSKQ